MLNLEKTLAILSKYGYSSTTLHPYAYQNKNTIGICYSFVDQKYGMLERIAVFNSENMLEEFIKKFQWYKVNGNNNNVTMSLTDYESENPQIIYHRNNRIMAEDEMFDLKKYDELIKRQKQSTETNKYLRVVEDILNLYDEKKAVYDHSFAKANELQQTIRHKYSELQGLVDKYNKKEHDYDFLEKSLPIYHRLVNLENENAIKTKFSQYQINIPEVKAANELILAAAKLLEDLETDENYFELLPLEFSLQQELDLLMKKIDWLETIMAKKKSFFRGVVNLRRQFKKIEQAALQPSFNKTIVSELKKALAKKYDALKEVSYLNYGSYLLSVQNFEENDFDELAQNFKKAETLPVVEPDKDLSYDEVLIDLAKQYENLTQKEKNALDLVNTDYYKLIKIIVSIKDYASLSIDDLLSFLNITDGFAALKISCYDNIKLRLEDSNDSLGTNILEDIAFNSAEDFIASILLIIETLKKIDLKIVGPIRGYFETLKYDNLLDEELVVLSSNVNSLISGVKQKENRIVLVDLEVDTPVLYSPNVLIIPDADSTTKIISYRKTTNTELILDLSRYKIKRANSSTVVSRYYSDLTKSDGKTIVSNLNLVNKNIFVEVDLKEKK